MIATDLPLIDLHRHLDGNIRASTIWQLAHQHNIALPCDNFDDFIAHTRINDKANTLVEFLQKLDWGVNVLKTLDDIKLVSYQNIEDLHKAGIDYAELRFSPYYMGMAHNLSTTDVVAAVIDGVQSGLQDFPVKANLIGILSRTFGVEACHIELNAILAHKQHFVAVDLAGDELGKPATLFVEHFNKVAQAGLCATVHAGEADGPSSVWNAINLLSARRIGHGVNSYRDNALMDYLRDNNIFLETCLTSNYQTGTVERLDDHPIHTFIQHGVGVCLNTDDPAVEGIELRDEYALAKNQLGFTDAQLRQLQLNSLKAAFISDSERTELKLMKQK
ncbi:adenosine deaminase [Thalassotalea ponticola]|uniref:adenosine deaminase n=1 Tax=Thalassotalea ponticola TaxID=1523392 RepID=UPI0025B5124B|nr:adenosine deaminase [Thalassotalea ponticola]MDN3651189.1 adenosine deaminase [Thalassotalea ponticola]